ncbi:hypothetical protein Prudu_90S000100 [Prunus dulcis]|uniref:F-box family protein with DUF295 n=1 Tax=Prunus dulcis TaxID=3755 RepID=A0A5H2Y282_PRUDU|nr:hypothetical protein Prudu_90S000100 [Prunus dulcis]
MGIRGPADQQEKPSKGQFSSDHLNLFKPTSYPFSLVITQSWADVYGHPARFQFMSVHSTLPHEFRGRSDRECQDLRLGRLGVPRPARIAARLTLCPRDLPGFGSG